MTKSENKATTILSSLQNISNQGINLYINGEMATPDEIATRCVNDETVYMPDFVMDDSGALKEIRYDKVVLE
ncbi:MAG: hypothetical protein FWE14_10990 [Lachnospiraceae bacterium]|nr:hypothetical protein [Lachnospiraceae bacterium]